MSSNVMPAWLPVHELDTRQCCSAISAMLLALGVPLLQVLSVQTYNPTSPHG